LKNLLIIFVLSLTIISCSAPKFAYKFDYHDYNAGRKEKQAAKEVAANPGPVAIQPEMLVAEADVSVASQQAEAQLASSTPKAAPLTITKSERKMMVKNLKAAVKEMSRTKKSGDVVQTDQGTKAMDSDLKMSIIFLLLSIIAGALVTITELFWILSIAALVVAVIFFVKWLMRQ